MTDDSAPADASSTEVMTLASDDPLAVIAAGNASSAVYDARALVRPLQRWEIARDHLVFADMCGLDTGKRHIVHFLEPRKDGEHGGVILTAAGNTVQILTLAPFSADVKSQSDRSSQETAAASGVLSRQYLFGFGGGGIGSLAVHPTKQFFAVGEKGVKPTITIYAYPSLCVCAVLRNGTEFAYSSVVFSQDGEKLASVGSAPDYLLTVWHWRQQQTILRCKAFGQDVFSVQFAPNDSGFLTTSGVGHIRMWKMASTFTGLKLQGDIGKFGKSELSDIEAFCVLPDKKVLSGTERGVLLLWDGNFIKCEVMTSRRHLPHAGAINVVDYDADEAHIVTAGTDGFVKFWSFDSIDRADVLPDDTVALVPKKRQFLIAPRMDIRAVVKESAARYLIQDGAGAIHLLLIEGDEVYVELDYVRNDTGRVTGIACSPYEHLAASCGEDGSVRAWDYVRQQFLFGAVTSSSRSPTGTSTNESESQAFTPASATAITWVPSAGALISDQVSASRQVAVGFSDGLIRILLMDLTKRQWVRTNVFKAHRERVTCLAFAPTGTLFASASDDGTFFVFRVVANAKTTKFSKYPPEYEPLGFQRTGGAVRAMHWRDDAGAVLVTLQDGKVLEFVFPDGGLDRSVQPRAVDGNDDDDESASEHESFELHLTVREYAAPFQRNRPMASKELEALEALNPTGNPHVEEKVRSNFHVEVRAASAMAWTALYASIDSIYMSCQAPFNGALFLCRYGSATPVDEFASEDAGHIAGLALSASKRFVLCSLTNGKFQLRSARKPHAFLTGEFHDYAAASATSERPSLHLALSFDDSFVLTAGRDGNLSFCRLHSDKLLAAAQSLATKRETLLAEAKIVASQAMEKQRSQLDVLQQALADSKNSGDDSSALAGASALGNELTSLPAFHHAKALASYLESCLEPPVSSDSGPTVSVATDDESFGGVVRLVSDPNATMGLASATSVLESGDVPTGSLLGLLEVPDVANPRDAYTIEDAKLKSKADAKATSTKSKQDRTRDVISQMRRQLSELKALNASYPPESRLDDDEWEIDLDYGELLTKMGDAACDEVRKELAFSVEREELLLMKMRETYVSPLAVELITLHAFESGLSVQSFRTMKMPAVLQKRLNEIHTADSAEARARSSKSKAESARASMAQRKPSVLHIMSKTTPLSDEFPLRDDERKLIQQSALAGDGAAPLGPSGSVNGTSSATKLPPGAPVALDTSSVSAPTGSVHGFEARKRLRADRKERLAHWISSKPGEDADDPRDVVAIAFAQRNMGDYKLKSALNYVVPEEQRVNAARKRRQMALLEERLYEARLGFNAKVLELRELKLLLIQELTHDQKRLDALYAALAVEAERRAVQHRRALEVDLHEWPEQRERVSDADIEVFLREKRVLPHSLATSAFPSPRARVGSISIERRGSSSALAGASLEDRGAGGRRESMTDRSIVSLSRKLQGAADTSGGTGAAASGLYVRHLLVEDTGTATASLPHGLLTVATGKDAVHASVPRNLDADDAVVRVYLMQHEVRKLERKTQDEVSAFDAAVAHLRREKMALDVVFKKCELRLFTLLSELVLLEAFESKETLLSSKLEKSKGEKAQVVAELSEIQDTLASKRKELEEWSKQEKAIQSEFVATVNGANSSGGGAPHPSFSALQKIFKKKIKRAKKKPGAGGKGGDGKGGDAKGDGEPGANGENGDGGAGDNGDDDDDDEDDDDDDSDFDENDDDDDDEDDVCPTGCDLQLYEKVLTVRERRADVDDAMSDLTKAMDELRKSNDRQVAKQRQIDKELHATELDIQAFQSEKQTRFNQLDVVVALSKHQVRCLEPVRSSANGATTWTVPEHATSCLVFAQQAFDALAERIESLQRENRSLRQQFRDLHKQQSVLARDKKVQNETIGAIALRCEQLQLLKFGQLVDMDVLDRACDTSKLSDLQARVRVKELESERALRHTKQAQQELSREILRATERNTALLGQIAELSARQSALERELNHASASPSVLQDDAALLAQEMRERSKLVRLVKLQAREAEALKQEIGLLRGKDGKVYAPRM